MCELLETVRRCEVPHCAASPSGSTRDNKVSPGRPFSLVRQPSHACFSMNYIRGAVYAISAPYQYYKELPPLNPSTLTGAIDVVVVRRPIEDGTDVELVSSPFHVRFGKWQVLRPADKKVCTLSSPEQLQARSACQYPLQVNVTVNGKHIPFNMKIGEAGEAFFIFETAGDVPDELITSPLLEAVRSPEIQGQDAQASQLGARDGKDGDVQDMERLQQSEPDFLDLDASPTHPTSDQTDPTSVQEAEGQDEKEALGPSSLFDRAVALGASVGNAVFEKERDEVLKAKERAKAIYQTTQEIAHHGTTNPDDVPLTQRPESMPSEPIYNDGMQNTRCISLFDSNIQQRCRS